MTRRPITVRIATWSATHPWLAIGVWTLFVVLCVGASTLGMQAAKPDQLGQGESGRAAKVLSSAGLTPPATENVLITSRSGNLDDATAKQAAEDVAKAMRGLPEVVDVAAPVPAENGKALVVQVTMAGDPGTADQRVTPLLNQTAAVADRFPGLRLEETGAASVQSGINDKLGQDFTKAETLSLPITLLIMMIAFGAIIAAGVPVLLATSSVGSALGLWALVSNLVPDPGQVPNMILLMGMAVGVDYSLFYLKRERQERAQGKGRIDAIEIAAATSGHAVVVSGIAVIVSMAALFLTNDLVFTSLAAGSILVVVVAVVGSLTVLPAMLAKFGKGLDRPRIPLLWRLTNRTGEPRLWPALLRPILKFPALTLILAVGALVFMALPAVSLHLKSSSVDDYSRSIPAIASYDKLTSHFQAKGTTHDVVVEAPRSSAQDVTRALADLTAVTSQNSLFAPGRDPHVRSSADGTVHTVTVATLFPINSDNAEKSVRALRDKIAPQTVGLVKGAEVAVGGEVAASIDYAANVKQKLPWVVGLVLLLMFVVMVASFRSVVVGLVALLINTLSAGAAFGLLVLVFQRTWAQNLLDFKSAGAIVSWIPLFLFVVLFGLSMDYHVFVVGSIREAAREGGDIRQAVSVGITRSAGVVTSAAVVMVSVFAIFATLSFIEFKELGVGLALSVLLDAVIIRGVVLPALMTLLGKANWWPSRTVDSDSARELDRCVPVPVTAND